MKRLVGTGLVVLVLALVNGQVIGAVNLGAAAGEHGVSIHTAKTNGASGPVARQLAGGGGVVYPGPGNGRHCGMLEPFCQPPIGATCPHVCIILKPGETPQQAIAQFERVNHCVVRPDYGGAGSDPCAKPLPGGVSSVNYEVDKLKTFEGDSPWMYLDSKGKVTVGIGDNIDSNGTSDITFYKCGKKTNKACICDASHTCKKASSKDVEDAIKKVKKDAQPAACKKNVKKCYGSTHYKETTDLRLLPKDREAWTHKYVKGEHGELVGFLPDFDTLPDQVRVALYDMAYNLSQKKLAKYKRMFAAIKKKDWKAAANESHRNGVQDNRNKYVKNLFLKAYDNDKNCKK